MRLSASGADGQQFTVSTLCKRRPAVIMLRLMRDDLENRRFASQIDRGRKACTPDQFTPTQHVSYHFAMNVEWERMLGGELYDPSDPELAVARLRSQRLCRQYNGMDPADILERQALLRDLFALFGERSEVVAPFHCDYGCHIQVGSAVFLNFGCVILDCAKVTLGDRTLIGPSVQIYAATHPLEASIRGEGRELALPVTIGADVWIGGGAILCPGITIGDGTTIGAGSVVTRDIPPRVFAAGNPCRVIRQITKEETASELR